MQYKVAWRAICVIGVVLSSTATNAGLLHPGTWKVESDDKKHIFVMLSPLALEDDYRYAEEVDEIAWIRSTYPKSGLYLNNGSTTPAWTYSEGFWRHERPIIAPDGEHVIFPGDWTYDEYGLRAVEFMRCGVTIRTYSDADIIPQWRFKAMLNGFKPPACSHTYFDPVKMTYTIRTNQGEQFTFDVTTGEIVAIRSPFPFLYGVTTATMFALSVVLFARWRKKRRARIAYSGALGSCRRKGGSSCGGSGCSFSSAHISRSRCVA